MFKTLIAATTIATLASLPTAGLLQAADATSKLTLKPLQAASFKAGGAYAVAYFLNDGGRCKVVVTSTGEPDGIKDESFTAHRFDTAIADGAMTRATVGSNELALTCRDGGQAMGIVFRVQKFAEALQ